MNRLVVVAVLSCYALGLSPTSRGQAIQFARVTTVDGQGGFFTQWDAVHRKLLLYRNVVMASVPAVRMYGNDGTEIAAFPVRDIENSWYVDVWGVAAAPHGGMVLAAAVGYTAPDTKPAEVKTVLLTYDGAGKLAKVWDVWPHQFFKVAVDSAGNVYGLGLREGESPYPLIVKYSPRGKVLKEFFSTSLLLDEEDGLRTNSHSGENQMFIADNSLFVWLAASSQLFRFTLDGELIRRTDFKSSLDSVRTATKSSTLVVYQLANNDSGHIIAQLALWALDPEGQKSAEMELTRLLPDGKIEEVSPLMPMSQASGKFLWAAHEGRSLYLEYDPSVAIARVVER